MTTKPKASGAASAEATLDTPTERPVAEAAPAVADATAEPDPEPEPEKISLEVFLSKLSSEGQSVTATLPFDKQEQEAALHEGGSGFDTEKNYRARWKRYMNRPTG